MRTRNVGTEILDFSASLITTAILGLALLGSAYVVRLNHVPNGRAGQTQFAPLAWADQQSR